LLSPHSEAIAQPKEMARMANGEWRMANGEWRMANGLELKPIDDIESSKNINYPYYFNQ